MLEVITNLGVGAALEIQRGVAAYLALSLQGERDFCNSNENFIGLLLFLLNTGLKKLQQYQEQEIFRIIATNPFLSIKII